MSDVKRLLDEDHSEIELVPDEKREPWLTTEQKAQPGIPHGIIEAYDRKKRASDPLVALKEAARAVFEAADSRAVSDEDLRRLIHEEMPRIAVLAERYEAAVEALELLLAQADEETDLGACDGWVHPRPDGSGHELGQDAIHVLPFHHVGDACAFCEAAESARHVLSRLRPEVPA